MSAKSTSAPQRSGSPDRAPPARADRRAGDATRPTRGRPPGARTPGPARRRSGPGSRCRRGRPDRGTPRAAARTRRRTRRVQSCGTGTGVTAASGPISRRHGLERRAAGDVPLDRLVRQVLAREPERPRHARVPGEDDDPPARPGASPRTLAPDRGQWWIVRTASAASTAPSSSGIASAVACTAGARPGPPLSDHDRRGLDREHRLGRLVRARAGADVHDRPRAAERPPDRLRRSGDRGGGSPRR